MRPATAAGCDFERAFREALTFTSRRPGWLGGLLLTGLIIRAVLAIPLRFVFALFQILARVIQAVAGVALGSRDGAAVRARCHLPHGVSEILGVVGPQA